MQKAPHKMGGALGPHVRLTTRPTVPDRQALTAARFAQLQVCGQAVLRSSVSLRVQAVKSSQCSTAQTA
jgi:hypothetical protein